jgi:putative transposase
MARGDLRDDQWEKLEPCLPKPGRGRRGRPCQRNREVINGIMWIHRTGSPWDDMPRDLYGSSDTAYSRFNRWSKEGIWEEIFLKLVEICDAEQLPLMVDSCVIKAHPDAAGAKKKSF